MTGFLRLIIRINNFLVKLRRLRVSPSNILLLLPHCTQRTACPEKIIHDVSACKRCGQCDISSMLDLRDKFLLKCLVASGGRQAVKQARSDDVKVVVAVACEKELVDGIRAIFPKPVIAVINSRPNGPCKDTKIDAAKVREAIEGIVEGRAEG